MCQRRPATCCDGPSLLICSRPRVLVHVPSSVVGGGAATHHRSGRGGHIPHNVDQSDPARLGALLPDRELGPVLCLRDELGGEEGAAPFDAGEESCGLRLDEVEYGGALRGAGGCFVTTTFATGPAPDSAPWPIGRITLGVKRTGKPRTGNPFAPFEVAGAGDGLTVNLHGHEAGTGGHSQGEPNGTAPVLDPTSLCGSYVKVSMGRHFHGAARHDILVDEQHARDVVLTGRPT